MHYWFIFQFCKIKKLRGIKVKLCPFEKSLISSNFGGDITVPFVPFVLVLFAFFVMDSGLWTKGTTLGTKGTKGTNFRTNWGQIRQKLDKLKFRDILLHIKIINGRVTTGLPHRIVVSSFVSPYCNSNCLQQAG